MPHGAAQEAADKALSVMGGKGAARRGGGAKRKQRVAREKRVKRARSRGEDASIVASGAAASPEASASSLPANGAAPKVRGAVGEISAGPRGGDGRFEHALRDVLGQMSRGSGERDGEASESARRRCEQGREESCEMGATERLAVARAQCGGTDALGEQDRVRAVNAHAKIAEHVHVDEFSGANVLALNASDDDDDDEGDVSHARPCVGMEGVRATLRDRVLKHACLAEVARGMPVQRHVVVHAPRGWGKAHCVREFCRAARINYVEVSPYAVRPNLIADTVRLACALRSPTVVLFNAAHTWLTAPGATGGGGAAHQSHLQSAPFLGDFLNAVRHRGLLRRATPVWFVYATTVDPAHFYADFLALPDIATTRPDCGGVLGERQVVALVRATLGAHYREAFDLDAAVHVADDVLARWAARAAADARSTTLAPGAIVRACRRLVCAKRAALADGDVAQVVLLHEKLRVAAAAAAVDNDNADERWRRDVNEYMRIASQLVVSEADFMPSVAAAAAAAAAAAVPPPPPQARGPARPDERHARGAWAAEGERVAAFAARERDERYCDGRRYGGPQAESGGRVAFDDDDGGDDDEPYVGGEYGREPNESDGGGGGGDGDDDEFTFV